MFGDYCVKHWPEKETRKTRDKIDEHYLIKNNTIALKLIPDFRMKDIGIQTTIRNLPLSGRGQKNRFRRIYQIRMKIKISE